MNNRLSTEVLLNIFQFVKISENNTDIYQCISVCRSWKYAAQSVCYSSLTLKNHRQYRQLMTSMDICDKTLGKFVKTLNYSYRDDFTENELTHIATMFPFLEHLNIPLGLEKPQNTYKMLVMLHQESKFSRLRRFTSPMDSFFRYYNPRSLYDSYILCAIEYRHTLTKLSIQTLYWRTGQEEYPYYYYVKTYKKLFPNLRELYIEDKGGKSSEEFSLHLLEDFLDDCTTATVKSVYIATNKDTNLRIDTTRIKPLLNVEKLHLEDLCISYEHSAGDNWNLLYIIQHKFPQLKEFTFAQQYITFNCNNIMNLLNFASSIPVFNFSLSYFNDHRRQTQENEESKILSQFWDSPSMKTRFKKVSLSYHRTSHENATKYMILTQQRDSFVPSDFNITYSKRTPCFVMLDTIEKLIVRHGESFQILSVALSRSGSQPYYPDTSKFELGIAKRRYLSNNNQPSHYDTSYQQEDQMIIDNLLASIFGHCKNLKSLELKYLEINKIYDVPVGAEFSYLSSLSLTNCSFLPEFLSNLSPSIPKLKVLKIYSSRHIAHENDNPFDYSNHHDRAPPNHVFFYIFMPQTAIDSLYIENTQAYFRCDYNVMCKVNIASEDKVKYFSVKYKAVYKFSCKNPTAAKVTEDSEKYHLAAHNWRKKRNIFYSIQCNSIKQITIKEPRTDSVTAFNTEGDFK